MDGYPSDPSIISFMNSYMKKLFQNNFFLFAPKTDFVYDYDIHNALHFSP